MTWQYGIMDLSSVSRSLLNAALDPQQWTKAIDDAASFSGASGATLLQIKRRMPNVPVTASMVDCLNLYSQDGWHLRDERERGLPVMRRRGLFVGQDFASREEMESLDYYRGFLAPHEANWWAGVGVTIGDDEWALMLYRGDRHGPFGKDEQAKLLQLEAPLQQAGLIAYSLSFTRAIGIADGFEMVGSAALLVDQYGKIIRCNRPAERYLGTYFVISRGEISCFVKQETADLQKLIHDLCTDAGQRKANTRNVAISGKSQRPLLVQGTTLEGQIGDHFCAARAILVAVDPYAETTAARIDDIRRMFRLSNAEAALLSLLHSDVALPDAARQLNISYETARTQLKSIFNKTGTKRQSEVLRLVQNLARQLPP